MTRRAEVVSWLAGAALLADSTDAPLSLNRFRCEHFTTDTEPNTGASDQKLPLQISLSAPREPNSDGAFVQEICVRKLA